MHRTIPILIHSLRSYPKIRMFGSLDGQTKRKVKHWRTQARFEVAVTARPTVGNG
jgi:hypothetical protein